MLTLFNNFNNYQITHVCHRCLRVISFTVEMAKEQKFPRAFFSPTELK